MLGKVKATLVEMGHDQEWGVWDNEFRQGTVNGRHIAIVSAMESWSELDEDGKFVETFNKLYGDNAIVRYRRGMSAVFSNIWDEYWTLDKMSGL